MTRAESKRNSVIRERGPATHGEHEPVPPFATDHLPRAPSGGIQRVVDLAELACGHRLTLITDVVRYASKQNSAPIS